MFQPDGEAVPFHAVGKIHSCILIASILKGAWPSSQGVHNRLASLALRRSAKQVPIAHHAVEVRSETSSTKNSRVLFIETGKLLSGCPQ